MNRDQTNWLKWTRNHYPEEERSDIELLELYDSYYTCACETCERRKELGYMPMRLRSDCTTPEHQLDIGRVNVER